MDSKKAQLNFLLVFLVGVFILAIFIFRPFIYALALAAIFAVVFQPLYQKILKIFGQYHGLASFITTLIIIIFILTPLILLGIQIFKEASQLYFSLTDNSGKEAILNVFHDIIDRVHQLIPETSNFSFDLEQYVKQFATWLIQHLGAIFSNVAKMLVSTFIFLLAFYYFLKDGQELKKTIISVSPLADFEDETIFNKLELAINSVVKGNLVIALIQGTVAASGLAIFGVPNPVLWGTVAAITALIPGIGTSLVMIPAVLYLFLGDQILPATGLLLWGIVAVGLIDNFLGPKIVGRGMKLHPLLVILSVLGGITLFGPIGFILGPLSLSLFCALFEIYFSLFKKAD